MDARNKALANALVRPFDDTPDTSEAAREMAARLVSRDQAASQAWRSGMAEALSESWPAELAKSVYGAATLPGDVYAGKVNPTSDEAVGRAFELAGLVTGGAGAMPAGRNEMRMGIKAYHGSPHDFPAERLVRFPDGRTDYIVGKPDVLPIVPPKAEIIQDFPLGRFRMDKIGTGEGAQAYGHGLYAAGNEDVGRGYRQTLSRRNIETSLDGQPITSWPTTIDALRKKDWRVARYLDEYGRVGGDRDEFIKRNRDWYRDDDVEQAALSRFAERVQSKWNDGRMYEVDLNTTPDRLLDWDKPLSGQSDAVRRALEPMFGAKAAELPGQEIYKKAAGFDPMVNVARKSGQGAADILPAVFPDATQSQIQQALRAAASTRPGDDVASNMLRERGIDGIKYLDAGSRAAGDGSRNYVMFDDKLISILRKYGVATAAALPAAALAELGLTQKEAERTF